MHANDHERFTVIACRRGEWLTVDHAHPVPIVVATFSDDHTARAVTQLLNDDAQQDPPIYDTALNTLNAMEPF